MVDIDYVCALKLVFVKYKKKLHFAFPVLFFWRYSKNWKVCFAKIDFERIKSKVIIASTGKCQWRLKETHLFQKQRYQLHSLGRAPVRKYVGKLSVVLDSFRKNTQFLNRSHVPLKFIGKCWKRWISVLVRQSWQWGCLLVIYS